MRSAAAGGTAPNWRPRRGRHEPQPTPWRWSARPRPPRARRPDAGPSPRPPVTVRAHRGSSRPPSCAARCAEAAEWVVGVPGDRGERPVVAQVEPGALLAALPEHAPEQGEPLEAVIGDLDTLILPGITHWNHPGLLRLLRHQRLGARNRRRADRLGAERERDAVAHVARGDRARAADTGLGAGAARAARGMVRPDHRHGVELHVLRAGGCPRGARAGDPEARDGGPERPAGAGRLHVCRGPLVGREGVYRARAGHRERPQDRNRRRLRHARRPAGAGNRGRRGGRPPADGRDRHGGDDVDHQRRSRARDRRRLPPVTGSGCTSTPPTAEPQDCCRRTGTCSPAASAPTPWCSTRTSGC